MDLRDIDVINPPTRRYLPQNFEINSWDDLEQYLDELNHREINSASELESWLLDKSELEAVIGENSAWRYISYSRNTEDEKIKENYLFFIREISPKLTPAFHKLDEKLVASPHLNELNQDKYFVYLREVKNSIELFNEKNIPIQTKISEESRKFAEINGAMTVNIKGNEYTMQQAAVFLKQVDREVRKEAYEKISERRHQDHEKLDNLFDDLKQLRHQVGVNAGFENYRDYKFRELGRFDYSLDDVHDFHNSVRDEIVPIVREIALRRKEALGYETLRPYDGDVDVTGKPPLKPFQNGDELINKTIESFMKLNPYLGNCLRIMKNMGYIDLESRKGKAPGGYNYPLSEIGVPFIFMNAAGTLRDLKTMVHEGGHAVHTFLTRDLPLTAFKHTPSEVAELASMSMELLSMDYWDIFFLNEDDLKRAKRDQLEGVLEVLPWVATIDKFQHWIYTHPEHNAEDRKAAWLEILNEFSTGVTDFTGYEHYREYSWQRQLHLYEVPFYYIEYGIAQLGAIAVWKEYRENREQGLKNYMEALKLGYTQPIPRIYETAGVNFSFSREYIHDLANFVRQELAELE